MISAVEKERIRDIKRWATRSVKSLYMKTGNKDDLIDLTKARYGENIARLLIPLFDTATSMNGNTFYCGRCLRFFNINTLNPQRIDQIENGLLYCDECNQSKIDVIINLGTGEITRQTIEKAIQAKKDLTTYEKWKEDPSNVETTLELLKEIAIRPGAKQEYYIEIVLKRAQDWRAIKNYYNWVELTTRSHRILMATSNKELTIEQTNALLVIAESVETSRL